MDRLFKRVRSVWLHRLSAVVTLGCLIGLAALIGHVRAQAPVIQAYLSDSNLARGRVVVLAADPTKVVAAPHDKVEKIYGVVVDPNDAPVTLTNTSTQKVFVATTGRYQVLVSSENGAISVGDYISLSQSDGIAAKAADSQRIVLGKALQGFDGKTGAVTKTSDGSGIARIMVDINISKNPTFKSNDFLPDFIRKTGEAIAGKPLNPLRIYLGAGIIVVTGFITAAILYSGVKSSLISVGRNPLSKKSITRGLIQVLLFSLIIFLIGVFGVYLLLKL